MTSLALVPLFEAVFDLSSGARGLALLIDLPDDATPDSATWTWRRELALEWTRQLKGELELPIACFAYENVRRNNADLPSSAYAVSTSTSPAEIRRGATLEMDEIFSRYDIIVALTHFSATAPLKLAAPKWGLRAATMPGFCPEMLPALDLDFNEVGRRVDTLAELLTRAGAAHFRFSVDGATSHALTLDLRHRSAHASSGLIRTAGKAGNLPSGEAYIVPYEGELQDAISVSGGTLPVQFGDEVVVYRIVENRAVEVLSEGPESVREASRLRAEPAYGNMAELGLGVLGELGVKPVGTVLIDEKLGLHIAFGRSDHFGGQIGAADFSRPEAVVHIDRVYVPEVQPRISVSSLELELEGELEGELVGERLPLIRDDRYVIDFSS